MNRVLRMLTCWLPRADDPKRIDQDLNKMVKTNVTGNIHLYNLFLPLILKGQTKKVICITSGLAEVGMINSMGLQVSPLYTITKAAMNVVTAKFSVEYKKDGVLFIGICPGMVGGDDAMDPSQRTYLLVPMQHPILIPSPPGPTWASSSPRADLLPPCSDPGRDGGRDGACRKVLPVRPGLQGSCAASRHRAQARQGLGGGQPREGGWWRVPAPHRSPREVAMNSGHQIDPGTSLGSLARGQNHCLVAGHGPAYR